MQQTFWQKFKVAIIGILGAVVIALLPVLQPSDTKTTIAAVVMAAVLGISSWVSKNLRGKAQSIGGIIISVLIAVLPTVFSHGKLDLQNLAYMVLSQLAVLYYGYSAPPFKPSSYEHDSTIVQAKVDPDYVKDIKN